MLAPTCVASVAPMLGVGAAVGCCPLALKDWFTGGRSLREQLVKLFRRAVQLPLQCVDAPKVVINAPLRKAASGCAENIFGRIDSQC